MKKAVILALLVGALAPQADAQNRRRPRMLEEEVITGEVKHPLIELVIQRQNLAEGYELELRESFLPRIINSVEQGPF